VINPNPAIYWRYFSLIYSDNTLPAKTPIADAVTSAADAAKTQ
jgi:hypothetical protein